MRQDNLKRHSYKIGGSGVVESLLSMKYPARLLANFPQTFFIWLFEFGIHSKTKETRVFLRQIPYLFRSEFLL